MYFKIYLIIILLSLVCTIGHSSNIPDEQPYKINLETFLEKFLQKKVPFLRKVVDSRDVHINNNPCSNDDCDPYCGSNGLGQIEGRKNKRPCERQKLNKISFDKCSQNGVCILFYLCNNNTILTNGNGLIEERMSKFEVIDNDPCTKDFEICCQGFDKLNITDELINDELDHVKENADYIADAIQIELLDDGDNNNIFKDNIELESSNEIPFMDLIHKPDSTSEQDECGRRFVLQSKILNTNSSDTVQGEFPWMAMILKRLYKNVYQYKCGGSIIHERMILTAAHCIQNVRLEMLKIRVGEWDTRNENKLWPHQERIVSDILIHEDFDLGTLRNDIALLKLDEPLKFSDHINLICLPSNNDWPIDDSEMECIASGWGRNAYGNGKYQRVMKKVQLPIISHGKCQILLRATRLGHFFLLDRSFICAGGQKDMDTCKGDGGSPLVCPIRNEAGNRFYQAGIVSWGISCGMNRVPGVYVNVAQFRSWIDSHLNNLL